MRRLFIVGLDDDPGAVAGVRAAEDDFLVLRVGIPKVLGLAVQGAEFPLLQRIVAPGFKAGRPEPGARWRTRI